MYTVNLNTIGLFVAAGALIGLLIGLGAGLMWRGDEEKAPRRGLVSALRLWRHKTDGALWVQLDDITAASPEALPAEQRTALVRLVRELQEWTGMAAPQREAPPPATPPPPEAHPASPPAAAAPPPGAPRPPEAPSTPASPPATPSLTEPDIKRNPFAPFREVFSRRKTSPREPETPLSDMSIAAQVDEILQEMLDGTDLEDRGIRLMELPGQGMVVMIGLEKFDTVSDVPYDDVRVVIQRAVAAWEQKMLGDA